MLERRMRALLTARPDLEPALALQAEILRETLAEARPPDLRLRDPPLTEALRKLNAGVPLLDKEPLSLDVHYAADLFERLLNVVVRRADAEASAMADPLVAAANEGRLDPEQLFTEAFLRHHDHVAAMAAAAGIQADFLFSLASVSVAPLARACAARLAPVVDQLDDQVAWRRGYCPVCGGPPLLGELRGVELRLFLRCAACGLAWPSRRLFCPVCESDNHHALHTLKVEGDQRFSAQLCDGCGAYLKIGNAFEPPPAELLALDDLASADLDVVAVERGYARPSAAGFRLSHPSIHSVN